MPVSGIRIEAVGNAWVAFSPASGETMFLNDESAAILEVLAHGPAEIDAVCATLAEDSGTVSAEIAVTINECWPRLVEAGLVRTVRSHR
jgi:PqqD family protein of HPr-rel-A system